MKKKKTKHIGYMRSDIKNGLLFCAPWIVGFLVFTAYPIIQTLIFSFGNVSVRYGSIESTPVGWNNYYYALFTDSSFLPAGRRILEIAGKRAPLPRGPLGFRKRSQRPSGLELN